MESAYANNIITFKSEILSVKNAMIYGFIIKLHNSQ